MGVLIGTRFVLSARAWPIAWLGLELNLMCFVPVIIKDEDLKKTCIIYFVTQRIGSLLIVGAGLLMDVNYWLQIVLIFGILLKMGAMPFHFWVPMVVPKLGRFGVYAIQTWQKVAPISLMLFVFIGKEIISLLNVWVGALTIRSMSSPILVVIFSGIVQIGWIFSITGKLIWWFVGIYFLVLAPVVAYMYSNSRNFGLSLINGGGLPPFTGFIMKLRVVKSVASKMGVGIIIGRGVALVSYARLLINLRWEKTKLSVLLLLRIIAGTV